MNICQAILSIGWGGAEAWVYAILKSLRDKGESVSLITNQEMVKYYQDLDDVTIFNIGILHPHKAIIPALRTVYTRGSLINRGMVLITSYVDAVFLQTYLESRRKELIRSLPLDQMDIIHSHLSTSTMLVAGMRNLGIKTVATPHGEHAAERLIPTHPLEKPVKKWHNRQFGNALRKVDQITVVSNSMRRILEDWLPDLRNRPLTIPVGIDVTDIQERPKSTAQLEGRFNMLFPGGWKWIKGGDLLITALSMIKREIADAHLYVALNVPQKHVLRKMVVELGLKQQVTFVGFLQRAEYFSLLNAVDLLILPSRLEAFALVLMEAMALGKPVIATRVGAIPELIRDGRNGLLIEPEPGQIAQAILKLYHDEPLRKELAKNNLEDVRNYDISYLTDRYLEFYRHLLMT